MEKFKYKYSLVIPVYNSAESLPSLFEEIQKYLCNEDYQIICINDSSYDNSWEVLNQLRGKNNDDITLVSFSQNFGQHAALYCGLMYAQGEYVVTLDDDLQHHPKEILKLIESAHSEKAEVVYGIYEKKKHGVVRNSGSLIFAKIVNRFASSPLQGSSFKLIHARVINKILEQKHYNFYLDEVLAWHSKKTIFTQVEHFERQNGVSGYSPLTLVKMSFNILLNYTTLPLKFITSLGFLTSLISFGFGMFYIYEKLNNATQNGFTALIVSIFFSTGLILFSLGIIGEYISRLFLMQTGKPPFNIKEVV